MTAQIYGLHIEGCNITDNGLSYLTERNKHLKCLSVSKKKLQLETKIVSSCRIDDCPKVTVAVLRIIVENYEKMEILRFNNCAITDVTATCKNLKRSRYLF